MITFNVADLRPFTGPTYRITGPEGVLDWRDLIGDPEAVFHHRTPQYDDEPEPTVCGYVDFPCYGDVGGLYGRNRDAFESGDRQTIESAMRAMYAQTFTAVTT